LYFRHIISGDPNISYKEDIITHVFTLKKQIMKHRSKIILPFLFWGFLTGVACAHEAPDEESVPQQQPSAEKPVSPPYVPSTTDQNAYCSDASSHSCYPRARRMTRSDRKLLRKQISEAGKILYPQQSQ
jgi:hypothetical protein